MIHVRPLRSSRPLPALLFATGILLAACSAPQPNNGSAPGTDNESIAEAPTNGSDPKLVVLTGDKIEFGDRGPEILRDTVILKNAGADSLHIVGVKPSCGCTTAPLSRSALGPGDTATVEVSVDAKNFSGQQHKSITITSNDPENPKLTIPITANIVRDITADPTFFPAMEDVVAGKEFDTQVKLMNTGTKPVTIQAPRLESPVEAVVNFTPKAAAIIQPGDSIIVVAHVKPLKQGMLNATVLVPTSSQSSPVLKLTLATFAAGS